MNKRNASFAVLGGMVVAGGFAAFQTRTSPASSSQPAPSVASPELDEPGRALPPDHPPIGAASPMGPAMHEPAEEGAPIVWTPPPTWQSVPNASSMRLATYRIPRARGDSEDGELSVTRAGGTTDANIQRWIGQFDGSATSSREERAVQGFKVSVVSVKGSFLGGGMMQAAPLGAPAFVGAARRDRGGSRVVLLLQAPWACRDRRCRACAVQRDDRRIVAPSDVSGTHQRFTSMIPSMCSASPAVVTKGTPMAVSPISPP